MSMADKKDEGKSSSGGGSRSIIDEIGRERAEALMAEEVRKAVARADHTKRDTKRIYTEKAQMRKL